MASVILSASFLVAWRERYAEFVKQFGSSCSMLPQSCAYIRLFVSPRLAAEKSIDSVLRRIRRGFRVAILSSLVLTTQQTETNARTVRKLHELTFLPRALADEKFFSLSSFQTRIRFLSRSTDGQACCLHSASTGSQAEASYLGLNPLARRATDQSCVASNKPRLGKFARAVAKSQKMP